MFQGSMVALVTPMDANGSIDYKTLQALVEWHIASGTRGLIIAGTTGEGATLTAEEQLALITQVVGLVAGRIPVIAGTGSHSTRQTLELTKQAKNAGADAALIVTPYYNKPTQQGLLAHYTLIADTIDLPIILYNVPARTACDLLPETVETLSKHPRIIGIKEATVAIERGVDILNRCDPSFLVLSGHDATAYELILRGGAGVISVTANIAPSQMQAVCLAALAKDKTLAAKLNQELMPLHDTLFLEPNPIPLKWALHEMGRIPAGIRLPLTWFDKKYHAILRKTLVDTGLLRE